MPAKKVHRKSLWRDIGDLRLPNPAWRVGRAAKWWARRVGLPDGAVVLMRPNGKKARADKTLKALQAEWKAHAQE